MLYKCLLFRNYWVEETEIGRVLVMRKELPFVPSPGFDLVDDTDLEIESVSFNIRNDEFLVWLSTEYCSSDEELMSSVAECIKRGWVHHQVFVKAEEDRASGASRS
jgi:hypothetical protein